VRLWSWEVFAHGGETVSYFRWRQAVHAQEQMHAGLNLPGTHEWSVGGLEAAQVARELTVVGPLPASGRAPVALVYDYEAYFITRIQPQAADFRFEEMAFRWYEAVRRLGLDVDIVPPGASLAGYQLVLVPSMPHVSDAAAAAFKAADAIVLYGPRSGSRTRNFAIPSNLPPGPLAELTGVRVTQASSLRPNLSEGVHGAVSGTAIRWREYIDTQGASVLCTFAKGDPALTLNGNHAYLACWPNEALLTATVGHFAQSARLATLALPDTIRVRRRGDLTFAFNYGDAPWTAPSFGALVLGQQTLPAQSVAIWR
jgi:beta-galactosidase